jgi:PadR family transcriptional regulator PadR
MVEMCILNLVGRGRMYGYQLAKDLTAAAGLVVSVGTIYPLLSRLKREALLTSSLVESSHGPARRVYELTSSGRRRMQALNEAWQEISDAVNSIVGKGGSDETQDA